MKYSEFKKFMEDEGFYVEEYNNYIQVYTLTDSLVANIDKVIEGVIELDGSGYVDLTLEERQMIAQKCMELSFTPPKDREEEEKYYLKHKGFRAGINILNLEIGTQNYHTSDAMEYTDFKTQFTQSEIDEMPECYTHPAVWEKIKNWRVKINVKNYHES